MKKQFKIVMLSAIILFMIGSCQTDEVTINGHGTIAQLENVVGSDFVIPNSWNAMTIDNQIELNENGRLMIPIVCGSGKINYTLYNLPSVLYVNGAFQFTLSYGEGVYCNDYIPPTIENVSVIISYPVTGGWSDATVWTNSSPTVVHSNGTVSFGQFNNWTCTNLSGGVSFVLSPMTVPSNTLGGTSSTGYQYSAKLQVAINGEKCEPWYVPIQIANPANCGACHT